MHGGLSNATRLAPATARRAQGQNALLRAPQTTRARPPRARIGPPTVGSKGGLAHRTWDFSPTERGIPPCFRREPRPSNVGTYRGTIEVRQQHLQSWHLHPLQEPTHAGAPTTARSPARAAGARELPTPPPTAPNGHHSAPGTPGRATHEGQGVTTRPRRHGARATRAGLTCKISHKMRRVAPTLRPSSHRTCAHPPPPAPTSPRGRCPTPE